MERIPFSSGFQAGTNSVSDVRFWFSRGNEAYDDEEQAVRYASCLTYAQLLLDAVDSKGIVAVTFDYEQSARTGEYKWLSHFGVADPHAITDLGVPMSDLSAMNDSKPMHNTITFEPELADHLRSEAVVIVGPYSQQGDVTSYEVEGDNQLMMYRLPDPVDELDDLACHGDIIKYQKSVLAKAGAVGATIVNTRELFQDVPVPASV